MPSSDGEGERRVSAISAPENAAVDRTGLSELLARVARPVPEPEEPFGWNRAAVPGAVVARFELLRELGRGGFGVVFEARDRELGRLVAFKAVRPGTRASSAQRVEWLRREAEATAQLNHENIVALYDVGRTESGPYLVFELLDGETLAERLQRGPLEPREAVRVAVAVARALTYAHSAGVLHRDLKPSNVFLTTRGQVKVLDFGLAHVFGWTGPVSGGTPAYMAPEQWRGAPEDARTDLFALGVLLYEMITGRLPFHVHDGRSGVLDPGASTPALEGLPSQLRSVVGSAIAPRAELRPPNAEVLLERLLEVDGTLAVRARSRWHGRSVALVAALVAAVSALGVWQATKGSRSVHDRQEGSASAGSAAPSLDAYAHYFRAKEAADSGHLDEAATELDRALDLDPELALAHYYRAHLGEFSGVPMSTRRAQIETALRFSQKLPAKERLLVQAWAAHVRGENAEASRIYRSAVKDFPEDPDVLYFAGDFLFHAGDLESAATLFLRAMDARPGWQPPLAHIVETFDGLGRLDRVLAPLRRAVAIAPTWATYSALGDAYLAMDEPDEAVRALRAAVGADGGLFAIQRLEEMLLQASRLDEAETEGRRLLGAEVPPRTRLEGYRLLVKLRVLQGRYQDALHLLDEIPMAVRATSPESVAVLTVNVLTMCGTDPDRLWLESRRTGDSRASFSLAYAGDLTHASELAGGLAPGPERDLYDGLVAWRRGHPDAAVTRLRSAARRGANTRQFASLLLAEVLGELGRDEEALDALRAASRSTLLSPSRAFQRPWGLLIAARSLERLGRRDDALARIDELLALWKSADPDLKALAEARGLRARLLSSGGHE